MIQKHKLIDKVVKAAKISEAKATVAYETILKEDASFRKQSLKNVESRVEKAVKVAGKTEIKKVELVREVPVKTVNTVEKIKIVEVIKEVPVEVIKVVEKIKEVKVIKEVPVDKIREVIKEVQVIKEVPVEVIKEITLIKEVEVPVEVVKEVKVPVIKEVKVEVIKEVKVRDEKLIARSQELAEELAAYKRNYNALSKQVSGYEKEIGRLSQQLKVKPKEVKVEVIKEVKVPVTKEVKVEVVKEVKIKDDKLIARSLELSNELAAYKRDYNTLYKQAAGYEKEIGNMSKQLKAKPKQVIKEVKVPVIKEVKVQVIKEVKVPVVKEVKIKDEKLIAKFNEVSAELSAYRKDYDVLYKQAVGYEKEIGKMTASMKEKPKVVEKIKEVKVPVEVIKEVKVKDEKALAKYIAEITDLKAQLKAKPKEIVKTVIKEVPVEIIKEVEVVKSIDIHQLRAMMEKMKTKEVSKTVVGETVQKGDAVIVQKREVKAGTNKVDDLTKIEGIGPKIAEILGRNGIYTFADLAKTSTSDLQKMLDVAGSKYAVHDPKTWAQQSSLAASDKWDELKTLQDKLIAGK